MSNINASFSLQVLEGVGNNVVTLSRSQAFGITAATATLFEQVTVAASATDVATAIPVTPNKIITIENSGTVDITVKFNANNGTAFILTAATGFMVLTTSTPITNIYLTNANATVAGQIKVFVGG